MKRYEKCVCDSKGWVNLVENGEVYRVPCVFCQHAELSRIIREQVRSQTVGLPRKVQLQERIASQLVGLNEGFSVQNVEQSIVDSCIEWLRKDLEELHALLDPTKP